MDIRQLTTLGLEKRWPRLARLQTEIAGLEKRNREAEVEVMRLRAELGPAREKDLDAEAKAIRAGKEPPKSKHEPDVQRKLERAERDSAVMGRALQAAQTDLGTFLAKHQAELYRDVAVARSQIGARVAEAARAALVDYVRYEDLFYVLKNLTPPPPNREGEPVQRLTQSFIGGGVQTTQRGPDRGEVEAMLQHLISLASSEGGRDAAA